MKTLRIILAFIFGIMPFSAAAQEVVQNEPTLMEPAAEEIRLEAMLNRFQNLQDNAHNLEINGKYIKKLHIHGVYQSSMTFDDPTGSSEIHSRYRSPYTDMFVDAEMQDGKTDVFFRINPTRHLKDYGYVNTMFSDFFVRKKIAEHNYILAGQSPPPLGMEGGHLPYTLLLANRSQIARTYGAVRAFGIRNMGQYDFAEYDIGIYDSTRYLKNPLHGAEVTGRLTLKPFAKQGEKIQNLKIGTAVNSGKNDKHDYNVFGSYIEYDYKKFTANFEWAKADGHNGIYSSPNKSSGYYSTVGYHLTPKIQVLGRFDRFDPNLDTSNNQAEEYTAGINYFIKGHATKIALNYVYRKQENNIDSNRYILMTQFTF